MTQPGIAGQRGEAADSRSLDRRNISSTTEAAEARALEHGEVHRQNTGGLELRQAADAQARNLENFRQCIAAHRFGVVLQHGGRNHLTETGRQGNRRRPSGQPGGSVK